MKLIVLCAVLAVACGKSYPKSDIKTPSKTYGTPNKDAELVKKAGSVAGLAGGPAAKLTLGRRSQGLVSNQLGGFNAFGGRFNSFGGLNSYGGSYNPYFNGFPGPYYGPYYNGYGGVEGLPFSQLFGYGPYGQVYGNFNQRFGGRYGYYDNYNYGFPLNLGYGNGYNNFLPYNGYF
ncbi:heterogeneous nuclear ribonucleoprotein A3 homolog 2-like [Amphibalanus amphitrite]|uniref:heterogeneous nuclear ribonucleoprotein A3 homolog 2-like n=1 Tax=Amphibalanus amphitrite TaxID=1232801 RepID=UPI001C8FD72D|nr:heterogeneous nuclear ribonucleoprotein A3 homolog 2-like [Amphibalanus amphitrite]